MADEGNNLGRVNPGDPLKFPAQTFNIFCDTAEEVARMRKQNAAGVPQGRNVNASVVTIRNDSGGDLDRFSVVGLGDPIIDATDNLAEFKNHITFAGDTPAVATHRGKFGILLEPVADGKLGSAVTAGLCQVRIYVGNADHQFADVKDGTAAQLLSGTTGAAQILWKETGTGANMWAIVRLGTPISYLAWAKVQAGHVNFNYVGGTVNRLASVKLLDDAGDEYGDAFDVYLPYAAGKHPAVFVGDKIVIADPVAGVPTAGSDEPVCVSDCSDDVWNTVKMFSGAVADIPPGWKLCDGTNNTVDLSGRFVMCLDADGQADENTIGDTGGYRKHGATENNHDTHATHGTHDAHQDPAHTEDITTTPNDGLGANTAVWAIQVSHDSPDWSHGAHDAHAAHSDSDNRPRYYVLAFMQRVE